MLPTLTDASFSTHRFLETVSVSVDYPNEVKNSYLARMNTHGVTHNCLCQCNSYEIEIFSNIGLPTFLAESKFSLVDTFECLRNSVCGCGMGYVSAVIY